MPACSCAKQHLQSSHSPTWMLRSPSLTCGPCRAYKHPRPQMSAEREQAEEEAPPEHPLADPASYLAASPQAVSRHRSRLSDVIRVLQEAAHLADQPAGR